MGEEVEEHQNAYNNDLQKSGSRRVGNIHLFKLTCNARASTTCFLGFSFCYVVLYCHEFPKLFESQKQPEI